MVAQFGSRSVSFELSPNTDARELSILNRLDAGDTTIETLVRSVYKSLHRRSAVPRHSLFWLMSSI